MSVLPGCFQIQTLQGCINNVKLRSGTWCNLECQKTFNKDIKDQQFCFHFDKTTTLQVKKQYDGYITYYSNSAEEITISYVGSLFVGHCPANDLVQHIYHFIEELQLSLDNLLNIGMDGPSVNK